MPNRMRRFVLPLLLAASRIHATPLFQGDGHELGSRAYLRAGYGLSDGDHQACFQAPGAGAKYRLGNECETYAKISAYYRYQKDKDGFYVHAEVMPEFNGPFGDGIEFKRYVQSWVEVGNLAGTTIDVWAGRRYNYRRDIHLNDYFYMNLWGDGLGVRDIPVGPARLALTYFEDRTPPGGIAGAGNVTQYTLDFGLYELASNPGGKVMADLRHARVVPETFGATRIHGADGWAVSVQHRQKDVLGGTNTAVVQYGQGAARSAWSRSTLESAGVVAALADAAKADDLAEARTWRVLDFHVLDGERWALMSSALAEWKDARAFDGTDQTWLSLGVRPIRFLDAHWRLVAELGYDRVSGQPSHGWLWKETLAVEWAPERSFWSRPAWRAYVSHADWSDSYRGAVAAPTYAGKTRGWGAGVQVEAWW